MASPLVLQPWLAPAVDSWPACTPGGAWSLAGTAGDFDCAGDGWGTVVTAAGANRRGELAVANADSWWAFRLRLSALPSSGSHTLGVWARASSASGGSRYAGNVIITSAGVVQTSIAKLVAGSSSTPASAATVPGIGTYAPNDELLVQAMFRGAAIALWVWRPGTARQAQPVMSLTDADIASGTFLAINAGATPGTPTLSLGPLRVSLPGSRTVDVRRLAAPRLYL